MLKHGFGTLRMSYQDHKINPPSIVLEIFEKTAGEETFSYRRGNAERYSMPKVSPYVLPKKENTCILASLAKSNHC